jgi:DNA-binding MarR family transcriptional regulator
VGAGDKTKTKLATEVWRLIFDFVAATVRHRNRVLARLGLTPNDARALSSLDAEAGRSMRSLADEWECDASTATWIVDRLEVKGVAERRAHPSDRRVKLVVLTSAGVHTRTELLAGIYEPPPELLELDRDALAALRQAVARLPTRTDFPARHDGSHRPGPPRVRGPGKGRPGVPEGVRAPTAR